MVNGKIFAYGPKYISFFLFFSFCWYFGLIWLLFFFFFPKQIILYKKKIKKMWIFIILYYITGNSKRGKGFRTWRAEVLCGAGVQCYPMAVHNHWSLGHHLLHLLSLCRRHNLSSAPIHTSGCSFSLWREVHRRERHVSCPMRLGFHLLLHWRVQEIYEDDTQHRISIQCPWCMTGTNQCSHKNKRSSCCNND